MSSDQDVIPVSGSESDVTDEFWSPSPSSSSSASDDSGSERGTPVPPPPTHSPPSEVEDHQPRPRTPSPPPPARASPRPIWLTEHQKLQEIRRRLKTGSQRLKIRQRIHEETKR